MSYQVLARKWRPRDFEQIVGQTNVVQALVNSLDSGRLHHAYLFTGTRGVGKTTLARILAKCLNCESGVSSRPCGSCGACREIDEGRFMDLIEVDAASRAKVDETRELMENVQFAPARGRFNVYLIDEVHMFSTHSFNALLKTLEEPPPHVKFLLATTDPQKLPVTVLSRCLQFNLKRLPRDQIAAYLEHLSGEEGIEPDPGALRLIARAADGSMRDALSLLDQAIAHGGGELSSEGVRAMLGTLETERLTALLAALADGDARAVMRWVEEMAGRALDFGGALQAVQSALQRIAIAQLVPEALDEDEDQRESLMELAGRMSPEDVQLFYQIALIGARDLRFAPEPRGGFEMTLLRMLAFRPVGSATGGERDSSGSGDKDPGGASAESRPVASATSAAAGAPAGPMTAESWARTLEAMNLSGLVRELAANSVISGCDGARIELKLSPGHAHLNTKNLKDQLGAAIERYRGEPVRLQITLDEPEGDTPAAQDQRANAERRRAAVQSIENDPNVNAICDAFDAVIDKDSIEPLGR